MPLRFSLAPTTVLHAASTGPLPIGSVTDRAFSGDSLHVPPGLGTRIEKKTILRIK
jgi:hypothetical protein